MSDEKDTTAVHICYIRSSLERIEKGVEDTNTKLSVVEQRVTGNAVEISGIKGRASAAGVVSGMVSGVAAGLAAYFGLNK